MSRLPSRKLSVLASYIYDGAGNKLGTRSRISYFSDRPLTTYAIQQPCRSEDHDYIGNYEFKNGRVHRVNTPYGYMAMGMFFTYLRDYQGNNRNHASYYAYGLPVQGSEVKDPDPYLYSGKEFYSLKGVNLYDFNARTYAPDIARFMQPDPLATENHGVSPYIYCNSDPINFIDPTGLVRYYVGVDGCIIPRDEAIKMPNIGEYAEELRGKDQIVILDYSGNVMDVSEVYDVGTIIGTVRNTTIESGTQSAVPFVSFIVRGDKNGTRLFEFLSDFMTTISGIEYSHFMLGQEGEQGLNYITTSHKISKECGATFLFDTQFKYGYTIREFIHSHQNSLEPGHKDIPFKDEMNKRYKLFVPNANPITFKIYLANSRYEKERYREF